MRSNRKTHQQLCLHSWQNLTASHKSVKTLRLLLRNSENQKHQCNHRWYLLRNKFWWTTRKSLQNFHRIRSGSPSSCKSDGTNNLSNKIFASRQQKSFPTWSRPFKIWCARASRSRNQPIHGLLINQNQSWIFTKKLRSCKDRTILWWVQSKIGSQRLTITRGTRFSRKRFQVPFRWAIMWCSKSYPPSFKMKIVLTHREKVCSHQNLALLWPNTAESSRCGNPQTRHVRAP